MSSGGNALCKECGREIVWIKQANGRTHPPLDSLGAALVYVNGYVTNVRTYNRHECDEDDIDTYEITKTTEAGVAAEQSLMLLQYREAKEDAWVVARSRPCPKCGAQPDEPCENLIKRRQHIAAETEWPHAERLPELEV